MPETSGSEHESGELHDDPDQKKTLLIQQLELESRSYSEETILTLRQRGTVRLCVSCIFSRLPGLFASSVPCLSASLSQSHVSLPLLSSPCVSLVSDSLSLSLCASLVSSPSLFHLPLLLALISLSLSLSLSVLTREISPSAVRWL
jgi:hypothetical protein